MKRLAKIAVGGLGTLLIVGGTLADYIAISPWNVGTSLASGWLIPLVQTQQAVESGTPLGGFEAQDEDSSNYIRAVTALAFAVLVMGFCISFPLLSERLLG